MADEDNKENSGNEDLSTTQAIEESVFGNHSDAEGDTTAVQDIEDSIFGNHSDSDTDKDTE
jgi:hypothetical protein